jgi:carboxymethylenebutenolidase
MGQTVEFKSNGATASGYLAEGDGPGVIVIQEWWGLVDHIKDVADRFAAEGFVALAPDIYRGVATTEPDEAMKLMMSLNIEQAAKDMAGAVRHLRSLPSVTSPGVGVVGFCMGGGLALWLGTLCPDDVTAVVPYYGVIPWPAAQPDYTKLRAAVQGHYAADDESANPDAVHALEAELRGLGTQVECFIYPDTDHAFANHHRPEVYAADAAETAWRRTVDFLHAHVG